MAENEKQIEPRGVHQALAGSIQAFIQDHRSSRIFFIFFILILHYVESKSWNNQNRNKFGRCWQKIWLKKLYKYLNKKGYGVIIHSLALYILKLNRSLLFEGDIKGFRCLGKDCTVLSWFYFYPWILPFRYRLKASFITKLDLIWQNVFWQNMFVNAWCELALWAGIVEHLSLMDSDKSKN